jgi:uncharacterized protein (DUF427 family)
MSEERLAESVWDYPRPPAVEASKQHIIVTFAGSTIAETRTSWRVLETSHPPTYYLPLDAVDPGVLVPGELRTWCEYKGRAAYFSLVSGDMRSRDAAWHYPEPLPAYAMLARHIAFYPSRVESCFVDGERVNAQPGDFYGGWITSKIRGPFKGGPGTLGW